MLIVVSVNFVGACYCLNFVALIDAILCRRFLCHIESWRRQLSQWIWTGRHARKCSCWGGFPGRMLSHCTAAWAWWHFVLFAPDGEDIIDAHNARRLNSAQVGASSPVWWRLPDLRDAQQCVQLNIYAWWSRGFARGKSHVAWPNGGSNEGAGRGVVAIGWRDGRATEAGGCNIAVVWGRASGQVDRCWGLVRWASVTCNRRVRHGERVTDVGRHGTADAVSSTTSFDEPIFDSAGSASVTGWVLIKWWVCTTGLHSDGQPDCFSTASATWCWSDGKCGSGKWSAVRRWWNVGCDPGFERAVWGVVAGNEAVAGGVAGSGDTWRRSCKGGEVW